MADVTISINGRNYEISCDKGQESRVADLAAYVDQCLRQIATSGAAYSDAHLLVITSLVLADELYEARNGVSPDSKPLAATSEQAESAVSAEEQQKILELFDNLTQRIENIASKVEAA